MDNYQKKILLLCILLFGCVLTSLGVEHFSANDEAIKLPAPKFVDERADKKASSKISRQAINIEETKQNKTEAVKRSYENRNEDRTKQTQKVGVLININTATEAELDTLPGIGPAIAKRIVAFRKEQPFTKTEDIMLVKGIGKKKFAKMRELITVE